VLKVQCGAQTAIYTGPNSPVIQINRVWHLNCAAALRRREFSGSSGSDEVKGESDERQAFDDSPPSGAIRVKRASESTLVDQISFLDI
jgi:hypothetical protein